MYTCTVKVEMSQESMFAFEASDVCTGSQEFLVCCQIVILVMKIVFCLPSWELLNVNNFDQLAKLAI